MAKGEHLFHELASDLSAWLSDTSKELAYGMHDGPRPPFAADVPDEQRLDYYEAKLFNPDGTPNEPNRQMEIQRVGVDGYARVLMALKKRRSPQIEAIPEEASYG